MKLSFFNKMLPIGLIISFAFVKSVYCQTGNFPHEKWDTISCAEAVGFSTEKLAEAKEYSISIGSAAVVVIVDGKVLDSWGNTKDTKLLIKKGLNHK